MRVALDGTPLTLTSGGLRRYTLELLEALRREFPLDRFEVVSDQLTPPSNVLERRWWTLGLPRALARMGADVFHGTNYSVPYLPLRPSVLTVHDVSPWLDPSWHHNAERVRRRTPFLLRLGIATVVTVPVEVVRSQVVELFGLHPGRVVVVPYAAAPGLVRTAPYSRRPYFLFAGTLEPRKNVPALVEAWRRLRSQHEVDLILAGRARADAPLIEPAPGLVVLGEVEETTLAALYSGAMALVYPSHYEGFGLPVLEAMQCGCAVVTSKDATLLEVSGEGAIHTTDYYGAMKRLVENPAELQFWREQALRRAREFSWTATARRMREVYAEAIRRFLLA